MKKRLLALLLVFAMLLPVFNVAAFADDGTSTTPEKQYSVTVYFSLTDDGSIKNGLGLQKMTGPYFELANYGLEQFYFKQEDYDQYPGWSEIDPSHPKSDLTPGTKEFAEGFVTMLHLFIYALEAYKYHYTADQIGTGALLEDPNFKAEDLNVSGSVGSMFLYNYWGMDYNLNYYKNYEYPLASEGWGATADQILLHNNDVVTLGHFSSYAFYNDPNSIFGYIQPTALGTKSVLGETTATFGDTVGMTLYHAGPDNTGNYTTAHTPITRDAEHPIPVYYCRADSVPAGEVGADDEWIPLTVADENGNFQIDTANLGRGTFFVAMPGLEGQLKDTVGKICCTPGGIRLVVQ